MSWTTSTRRAVTAGLLLLLSAPAFANPSLSPPEAERARRLMRQLGDANFHSREQASNELVRMGSAVEPILREGLDYPDPEVRYRCRNLLPRAMGYDLERRLQPFLAGKSDDIPGWGRFKEMVGDEAKTRTLFASMVRFDTEFVTKLDKSPAALRDKVDARCRELAAMQNYSYNAQTILPAEQLALMLFACLEPKVGLGTEPQAFFNSALHSLAYRPRVKTMIKENDALRKLLVKYVTDGGPYATANGLYILANLELKEVVDVARKVLKAPHSDSNSRGMALMALGNFGGRDALPEVLPFLDDKSTMGTVQFGNGNTIKTETRDVALAALVNLSGQNLRDYDFAYLKMFGGRVTFNKQMLSPSLLGFSDDQARDGALKKWKDWYAKNKSAPATN